MVALLVRAGSDLVTVVVFECVGRQALEQVLLGYMRKHHLSGEVYTKVAHPLFVEFCTVMCKGNRSQAEQRTCGDRQTSRGASTSNTCATNVWLQPQESWLTRSGSSWTPSRSLSSDTASLEASQESVREVLQWLSSFVALLADIGCATTRAYIDGAVS